MSLTMRRLLSTCSECTTAWGTQSSHSIAKMEQARASTEGSRRFHNHGESPYYSTLLRHYAKRVPKHIK